MTEFSLISRGLIFVHVSGLLRCYYNHSEDAEAAPALGRKQASSILYHRNNDSLQWSLE